MKKTLQDLLAEGKTAQVIDQLRQLMASDKDLHQQVLLTATRFADYEKQKHADTVAFDPLSIERNKINAALLHFIEQLPDHTVDTAKDADTLPKPPTMIQNAEKIYNIDHIDNANFS